MNFITLIGLIVAVFVVTAVLALLSVFVGDPFGDDTIDMVPWFGWFYSGIALSFTILTLVKEGLL